MENIRLEQREVLEYIKDTLNDYKIKHKNISNAKYHHNTNYNDASSIIYHGLLSLKEMNRLKLRNDSQKFLDLMNDITSHINGNDGISLSVVGLTDLYVNEPVYNPFCKTQVDFRIMDDVKAIRTTIHYGNEYIVYENINQDKIAAIDIRILEYIKCININNQDNINALVNMYNYLKEIALALKTNKLDIPLRDMSDNITLDVDKIIETPKIIIKK